MFAKVYWHDKDEPLYTMYECNSVSEDGIVDNVLQVTLECVDGTNHRIKLSDNNSRVYVLNNDGKTIQTIRGGWQISPSAVVVTMDTEQER